MYGTRTSRLADARGGLDYSSPDMMSRRHSYYRGSDEVVRRGSRSQVILDDDTRGANSRVTPRRSAFLGGGSTARVDVDRTGHHGDDDMDAYDSERRVRDGMLKMVRSVDDEALRHGGIRFRDGSSRRAGMKSVRPEFSDEARVVSRRLHSNSSYEDDMSMAVTEYPSRGKSAGSGGTVLYGIILECQRRTILEFVSQRDTFELPFNDRRLSEQIGPGTKIFMFDSSARELYGVFQVESYADIGSESSRHSADVVVVQVRVLKECIPLSEEQFEEIIQENYYMEDRFSESLTKEQVMRLLQIFRPVEPVRNMHVSVPVSRRALNAGALQAKEDFLAVSPENTNYKERRRREMMDPRASGAQVHRSQNSSRFPGQVPDQRVSSRSFEDYEDYVDDEALEDVPRSKTRLVAGHNPNVVTRSRQQLVRSHSNSGPEGSHLVRGMDGPEMHLVETEWPEDELDVRDYYNKRHLNPHNDMLGKGTRSSSPPWKETHARVAALKDRDYDSPAQLGYRDETSYVSKREHRHDDIDLNKPMGLGYTETALVREMDSKTNRRRVWNEELKRSSMSPVTVRSDSTRSALQVTGHLRDADVFDTSDHSVLNSKHIVNAPRKDYTPHPRAEAKSSPVPFKHSNGNVTKVRPRTVVFTKFSDEKPVSKTPVRKKPLFVPREIPSNEPTSRTPKVPSFQIKANFQTHGKGRAERIVTIVDDEDGRHRGTGPVDGYIPGGPRKRKLSVWSRICEAEGAPLRSGPTFVGKARVFSRLGPSPNSHIVSHARTSYNPRPYRGDENDGFSAKRSRWDEIEVDPVREQSSPDALEGEDYLQDDSDGLGIVGQEIEKGSQRIRGWNRKSLTAARVRNDGHAPERCGDTTAKVGRRKIVRPVIGDGPPGQYLRNVGNSASTLPAGDSNATDDCHRNRSLFINADAPDTEGTNVSH